MKRSPDAGSRGWGPGGCSDSGVGFKAEGAGVSVVY